MMKWTGRSHNLLHMTKWMDRSITFGTHYEIDG